MEFFETDDNVTFEVYLRQADGTTPVTLQAGDTINLRAKRPQDTTTRVRVGAIVDGPTGRVSFTIPAGFFPAGDYQAQVQVIRAGGTSTFHSEIFRFQIMRGVP
ncbi:MAG: hypothetical protein QN141_13375 [Armatimonadota bacterium]|nr:hypothetical protein [Armatimonadota bacterium]